MLRPGSLVCRHVFANKGRLFVGRWSLTLRGVQSCLGYLEYCKYNEVLVDSATFRGTLYEFLAKDHLESVMNCYSMNRVGGAGDNGVDLLGRWNLAHYDTEPNGAKRPSSKLLLLKARATVTRPPQINLESDVIALVQCKNYATRIKAATIRELAGIYEYHVKTKIDSMRVFFFLVSPFPLTKQAQSQVDSSKVPIIHIKLQPMVLEAQVKDDERYLIKNWTEGDLGTVYINPVASKLLEGLEVRKALLMRSQY